MVPDDHPGQAGAGASAASLPGVRGLPVEPQRVRWVAVGAAAVHVLRIDLVALRDDVHESHCMPAAEAVVLPEPGNDLAGLRAGAEALLTRQLDELPGREPRLRLDVVEVGLERHVGPSGAIGAPSSTASSGMQSA